MRIAIFGLAITSSWGNGHATTYRSLVGALAERGHEVTFFERDSEWYANNRDLPSPSYCRVRLYDHVGALKEAAGYIVEESDLAIVGSYVPDGAAVGEFVLDAARGVTAFYDIDTPITAVGLETDAVPYLTRDQVPRYDLYLSFTGGPLLTRLEHTFGARIARPLYCSVDPRLYYPEASAVRWDLGYLGTYSDDRQPALDRMMLQPATAWQDGRFIVAGAQYPKQVGWPPNVHRVTHLSPREHRAFYVSSRFTLNVTRRHMVQAGHSPSVRLFEAAACGTPIISDEWRGIEEFLTPGDEILIARTAADTLRFLRGMDEHERRDIGERARARVLAAHTSLHRAIELEGYVAEAADAGPALVRRDSPASGESVQ
jgi:spore maturation protein CgeB